MRHSPRWIAGSVIASVVLLSACAPVEEESTAGSGGATYDPRSKKVTMEAEAVERLDILSTPVRKGARGSELMIPYAAVVYGPSGDTWTYTRPESQIFQRAPILIDRIDGGKAFLSEGPRPGTQVVTQGAPELLGVEIGIDQ
jgi:hypothetical protein